MSNPTPKLSAIGKLSIGAETTFGVQASGGNTKYVKAIGVDTSGLTVAALMDEHVRQRDYQTPRIIGPRTGEIVTTHYMSGYSDSGESIATKPTLGDPPSDGFQMLVSAIGSALGNVIATGYAADVALSGGSASTTDAFNCTAGTGSTPFTTGQAVAWVDSDSQCHVGYAKSVTSGAVSLRQTGKALPKDEGGSVGKLWGGYTCFQTTGDTYHEGSTHKGFTLFYQGLDSDDMITAVGCMPTAVSISMAVGEMPIMSITWGVSHWTESGSGGLGGGAAVEAWAHPLCEPFSAGGWVTHGTTQANPMRVSSVEVDLQIQRPAIKDASFSSGVGGFGPIQRSPKVSFTVFRDYSEEITDFLNQGAAYNGSSIYSFTFGSGPGKMVNIMIPNGRIESYPGRGDEEGAVTSTVDVIACHYDDDTGSTPTDQSTPIDSDFRISFC